MDAIEFLQQYDGKSVDGILYNPPYSPRQISEYYQNVGHHVTGETITVTILKDGKSESF